MCHVAVIETDIHGADFRLLFDDLAPHGENMFVEIERTDKRIDKTAIHFHVRIQKDDPVESGRRNAVVAVFAKTSVVIARQHNDIGKIRMDVSDAVIGARIVGHDNLHGMCAVGGRLNNRGKILFKKIPSIEVRKDDADTVSGLTGSCSIHIIDRAG